MKCDAVVAAPVLMTAFEAAPVIAEEKAARRERRGALHGAVLKHARRHERDAYLVVDFFERPIVRAIGAHDLACLPSTARRQEICADRHWLWAYRITRVRGSLGKRRSRDLARAWAPLCV